MKLQISISGFLDIVEHIAVGSLSRSRMGGKDSPVELTVEHDDDVVLLAQAEQFLCSSIGDHEEPAVMPAAKATQELLDSCENRNALLLADVKEKEAQRKYNVEKWGEALSLVQRAIGCIDELEELLAGTKTHFPRGLRNRITKLKKDSVQ